MGWVYLVLLICWIVWAICTNIGKIVTFLTLVICGIVAASCGLLLFEWLIIGLARVVASIQNHGWTILWIVAAIVASFVAWCVWDSHKTKEQMRENRKALFARREEFIAGNPHYIEFFRGYDDEYQEWLSNHSTD
jgi:hypothetical protein